MCVEVGENIIRGDNLEERTHFIYIASMKKKMGGIYLYGTPFGFLFHT